MLIVCYGVLLRYVFGASTVWQLELSTYFLMFSAFVGGAYCLKHGDHVNLSLIVDRLPEKPRLYVQLVASVLGFVFVVGARHSISRKPAWATPAESDHSTSASTQARCACDRQALRRLRVYLDER